MKTSTKILAGLVLIGGVVGILYLHNQRFSFADKLKATVFDLWGIGRGRMDNIDSEDLSKSSNLLEARIRPHDSYKTFAGYIDESYVNSF